MGWMSKLAHIGEAVGGVALTATGAGAAVGVPLIAAGAGGLAQDFAGDSAQKQQQAATDAASKNFQTATNQSQALLSPYAGVGQGALNNLASLGFPSGPGTLPAGATPTGPTLTMAPGTRNASQGTPTGQTAVPRDPNALVKLADGTVVPASSLAALNRSSVRTN